MDLADSRGSELLRRGVHWTLLAGVIASSVLLFAGLIALLASGQDAVAGTPPPLRTLLARALHGNGTALINLGLLVLMGTPVLRVIVLAIGWTVERNRRFATVALTVLVLLAVSVVLGLG